MYPDHFKASVLRPLVPILTLLFSSTPLAATLLENGGFEAGSLSAWKDASTITGQVKLVEKDQCDSTLDTRGVALRGQYAVRLETKPGTTTGLSNEAVLQSDAFIAGDGFAFVAIQARPDMPVQDTPVLFEVSILDAQNNRVLASQRLRPALIGIATDCLSAVTPHPFSSHYFSSRAFAGQKIKIQFKQGISQSKNVAPGYTFIDQVVLFASGEQAAFFSRPHAQAGLAVSTAGMPYLTAEGSFDPDKKPFPISYSWWLDDQNFNNRQYFDSRQPCLSGLEAGPHRAVLYVSDGHHALSDTLQFYVPEHRRRSLATSDPECDVPARPVQDTDKSPITLLPVPLTPARETPSANTSGAKSRDQLDMPVAPPPPLPVKGLKPTSDKAISHAPAQIDPKVEPKPKFKLKQGASRDQSLSTGEPVESPVMKEIALEDIPLTDFNRNAYRLKNSGIRWLPDDDGHLSITTPAYFPQQVVKLFKRDGEVIETARYVGRPQKRARYSFSLPGSAYPADLVLRIGNTDYRVRQPGLKHR